MADREFTELVEGWVRGDRPDADWLVEPDYLADTYDTLCDIKRDVETQLTARKADFFELANETHAAGDTVRYHQAKAEYEAWKARALGFKRHVETALADVKALRRDAERSAAFTGDDGVAHAERMFTAIKADPNLTDDWKSTLCRLYHLACQASAPEDGDPHQLVEITRLRDTEPVYIQGARS